MVTHPWNLIRGVCLYRPGSPYLFEAVLASAKQAQRDLDRSWSAPRALIERKLLLQNRIQELECDQSASTTQESREQERGRRQETLIVDQVRTERQRRCEKLRAELAKIDEELNPHFGRLREIDWQQNRRLVKRLMLAGGDNSQACLAHLARIHSEVVQERVRLIACADARVEAAADEALNAMRKSMGLKERAAETDDPWDWNRHRRRSGGGWNCA
jgi:hypothetical protein